MSRFELLQKKLLLLLASIHLLTMRVIALPAPDALSRSSDHNASIIYYHNTGPNERGDFHFEFQTSNGITTKTAGNENGHSGVVQYVSPEGIPITMTYIADADGFHPKGAHIPKVPEYVLTTLEYIRTHPPVDERSSRRM